MELLYIFGPIVLPDCSPLVRDTLAHEKNTKGTQLGHLLTVTSRKSDFVIGFNVGARTASIYTWILSIHASSPGDQILR